MCSCVRTNNWDFVYKKEQIVENKYSSMTRLDLIRKIQIGKSFDVPDDQGRIN